MKNNIELDGDDFVLFDVPTMLYTSFKKEQEEMYYTRLSTLDQIATVGASDLACPKKTLYYKIDQSFVPTLSQAIRMRKGNVTEGLIEDSFTNMGVKFERQGEYKGEGLFGFITVHSDILIDLNDYGTPNGETQAELDMAKRKGKKYLLVELKTTNMIPEEPHDYWLIQTMIQAKFIADVRGIDISDIDISVLALELNNGGYRQYSIEYDEELTNIALEEALILNEILTQLIEFHTGERETFDFTVDDAPRHVGSLCVECPWLHDCLGSTEEIGLPDDIARAAQEYKGWKEQERNMKEKGLLIKEFLKANKTKKAISPGLSLTIRGGNTKQVLDKSTLTDEDITSLWEKNMRVFDVDEKALQALEPDRYKQLVEDHSKTKTTAESLLINRSNTVSSKLGKTRKKRAGRKKATVDEAKDMRESL